MTTSAAYHDAYALDYDDEVRNYECYLAEALFGLCFEYLHPGERVLDLGIGTGLAAQLFAKAGLAVHGTDFSPVMLELCRAKGFAVDLRRHDLQALPWPYDADHFHHLVCCGVFHFLPHLEPLFGEAGRVVKGSGLFAFTTKSLLEESPTEGRNTEAETFAHSIPEVQALLRRTRFDLLKRLRCFVGPEPFDLWVVRKAPA